MNRRKLFGTGIAFIAAAAASALGKDKDDKQHGKGKGQKDRDNDQDEKHHEKENRGGYFRTQDYVYVRQFYGGPASLPPGLRKKYYRTGTLPPGWEKRFQPFPPLLVQQLPPLAPYYDRGYIDGYAVVVDRRTRIIVDAFDILDAAIRR